MGSGSLLGGCGVRIWGGGRGGGGGGICTFWRRRRRCLVLVRGRSVVSLSELFGRFPVESWGVKSTWDLLPSLLPVNVFL